MAKNAVISVGWHTGEDVKESTGSNPLASQILFIP